jgi:hypothetical protein
MRAPQEEVSERGHGAVDDTGAWRKEESTALDRRLGERLAARD